MKCRLLGMLWAGILMCPGMMSAQSGLDGNISVQKLPLSKTLATNTQSGIGSVHVETPQLAKWKNGYALTYVDIDRKSWLVFLDAGFRKVGPEVEIKDRVVLQLVTDNGELAVLSVKRRFADAENEAIIYKEIYFSIVDGKGQMTKDVFLGGGMNIKQPGATEVDDIGNYRMIWDKDAYLVDFPIQHNFSKSKTPDTHQGDAVLRVSPEGALTVVTDWNSSHSFQQFLLSGQGYYVSLTKGDGPRGLIAHHFSRQHELVEYEDKYFPQIEQEVDNDAYFTCNPYPVPGGDGENYVPYMIGDGVMLPEDKVMVGFSTSNGRSSYDVGLVQVSPTKTNAYSKIKWLTETPGVTEHSLRMHPLGDGKFVVFWKSFAPKKADEWIAKMEEEFEDEDDDEDKIMQMALPDEQWMAIVNSSGDFEVKPQRVNHPTYYASDWKEDAFDWHNYISLYLDHTYSPMLTGHGGEVIWLYHKPFSKELEVNLLKL